MYDLNALCFSDWWYNIHHRTHSLSSLLMLISRRVAFCVLVNVFQYRRIHAKGLALNMSFQKMTVEVGKVVVLATIKGEVSRLSTIFILYAVLFLTLKKKANTGSGTSVSFG